MAGGTGSQITSNSLRISHTKTHAFYPICCW